MKLLNATNKKEKELSPKVIIPNLLEYNLNIPKDYAKGIDEDAPTNVSASPHYTLVLKRDKSNANARLYWKLPVSKNLVELKYICGEFKFDTSDLSLICYETTIYDRHIVENFCNKYSNILIHSCSTNGFVLYRQSLQFLANNYRDKAVSTFYRALIYLKHKYS